MKKIYIISGEISGEQYAAEVINALFELNPNLKIRAWGGSEVKKTKASLAKDISELSFMGFVEVVQNISKIRSNFKYCKEDILDFNPDKILFIDYPGFNLRIAKWASNNGFSCDYFIAPKAWAWNKSRAKKIAKYIETLYAIFPFEVDFFESYGVTVKHLGNPSVNRIREHQSNPHFLKENNLSNKPIIALLPGSRKQEIEKNLPVMLSIIQDFPAHQFCIAKPESVPLNYYNIAPSIKIINNQTYDLIKNSAAAIVCSGTATLEVALLKYPQIVCYKTSSLNYWIAKKLANVKFISLVNIIENRECVKELIQENFSKENLTIELRNILNIEDRDTLITNKLEPLDYESLANHILK